MADVNLSNNEQASWILLWLLSLLYYADKPLCFSTFRDDLLNSDFMLLD